MTQKKDKRTNNDLQNTTHKTKDEAIRTLLKPGSTLRVGSSCFTCGTHRVTLVRNPVISHEWGNYRIVITTTEHILSHLWHRYSVTVNEETDHPWLLITNIFTRNYWKLCFTCKEAWHSQYTKHSFNSHPKATIYHKIQCHVEI